MTPTRIVQLGITLVALGAAVVHIARPDLAIDGVTLFLLAVAALPWLIYLFKSLELPGGWKIEFQDLERVRKKADEAGLLREAPPRTAAQDHAFQSVAAQDPNLALVGLRIEIEKRLRQMALVAGVQSDRMSLGHLLRELAKNNALTPEQTSVLADMTGLLNKAAHGLVADPSATAWALETGAGLLATLDKRTEELRL
jgi:hypothetical protein